MNRDEAMQIAKKVFEGNTFDDRRTRELTLQIAGVVAGVLVLIGVWILYGIWVALKILTLLVVTVVVLFILLCIAITLYEKLNIEELMKGWREAVDRYGEKRS